MDQLKLNSGFKINPNLRVIFVPAFSLVLLLLLVFPVFNYGYQKIVDQNAQLKEKSSQITKLEMKLSILREVEGSVLESMDTSLLAVPSVNPSLWKLNQVYVVAKEGSLVMEGRSAKAESGSAQGLSSSGISFGLTGNFDSLMDYFEKINKSLPLMTIDSVGIKRENNTFHAGVSITTYRAGLPTQLPALIQPIKKLTDDEKKLLERLAETEKPDFTTIPPTQPSDRDTPFR